MKTFEITLRPPLPTTEAGLRHRIKELQEAEKAIRDEMKAIRGTGRITQKEEYDCLRCGHHWRPKRVFFEAPAQCPSCHNNYWNIPRTNKPKSPKEDLRQDFAPPPPFPTTLSERLSALRQPEVPNVEPMPETVPVTGEEPATDSPGQKSVVEENESESLADA